MHTTPSVDERPHINITGPTPEHQGRRQTAMWCVQSNGAGRGGRLHKTHPGPAVRHKAPSKRPNNTSRGRATQHDLPRREATQHHKSDTQKKTTTRRDVCPAHRRPDISVWRRSRGRRRWIHATTAARLYRRGEADHRRHRHITTRPPVAAAAALAHHRHLPDHTQHNAQCTSDSTHRGLRAGPGLCFKRSSIHRERHSYCAPNLCPQPSI